MSDSGGNEADLQPDASQLSSSHPAIGDGQSYVNPQLLRHPPDPVEDHCYDPRRDQLWWIRHRRFHAHLRPPRRQMPEAPLIVQLLYMMPMSKQQSKSWILALLM
uniref:Uncharacterized protein n=1 Tax=Hyaloperonospora arabidopsidis (strain Emoy2) TaxID=559515 RepID=M4BUW8_HYAAE